MRRSLSRQLTLCRWGAQPYAVAACGATTSRARNGLNLTTTAVVDASQVEDGHERQQEDRHRKDAGRPITGIDSRTAHQSAGGDPVDGVRARAPGDTPTARLDVIGYRKARWILERRRRHADLPPPPSPRQFVSGETFRYLGR